MATAPSRKVRTPQSLKMQAIGFLSRREYSRQELRMKLLAASRRRELAAAAAPGADRISPDSTADSMADSTPDPQPDPEREVDALLDWLQAHGYLSDQRFIESRVHARAARQGTARIRQELARHGLSLEPEQAAMLRESEFTRAQAVWRRKFGEPAADARGRAAQARFLAARGFAADIVRRIVGGEDEY
jgi:regulatory protein